MTWTNIKGHFLFAKHELLLRFGNVKLVASRAVFNLSTCEVIPFQVKVLHEWKMKKIDFVSSLNYRE